MSARTTPAVVKFQEELCGVKKEPPRHQRHQHSTVCKIMHAKVVLHRLEDLLVYVSQDNRPEHQVTACIKKEEEESPYIKEEEDFVDITDLNVTQAHRPEHQESSCIKKEEEEESPYIKDEEESVPIQGLSFG
ncbi:uncharacterized protein LOC130927898 isoform X4 [Corythoichthys intestinalis]|uniref:uncharacterized protein LOC130927898 isoform X4 n=1 Tax=Corythoichthys intestinalis TaxID=161448 RepID=UPI0025A621E1|nr:uncharacterized protein LOC130927898 isoform X4 [Corythoichthys intestinalis]